MFQDTLHRALRGTALGRSSTWGAYGELIYPVPGNREYEDTSGPGFAAGYFAYFGAEAAEPNGY